MHKASPALRLSLALGLSVACALSPIAAKAAAERPLIPLLSAEQITSGCKATIADLQLRVKALEQLPVAAGADAGKLLGQWDGLLMAAEDMQGPIDLLGNVSPDKAVRDAAEPCRVDFSSFFSGLFQNEVLYRKFSATNATDAVDRKLRQDILWSFEDTGVSLPAEKRARMQAILTRLTELTQAFDRNVRDNEERLVFSAEEVRGLPQEYLDKAKRDDKGNYLLGFAYPEYIPFLENADSSAARERYQFAFSRRGTPQNLDHLKEAVALRKEIAGLFGLPSYAEYVIRRRMAGSEAAVNKFLGEVSAAVTAGEKSELQELRSFAAKALNQPVEKTTLHRWDIPYWQNKLKKARFDVDQNALRKYFPAEAAIEWILQISGNQYGVDFVATAVPVWHSDVRYYDVIDRKSRQRLAGVYLDLYPRDGKYGHAAAFGVRGVSTASGRTPISALVANLDRAGLDSEELETLTHEFGHVLHGVLSRTRYVAQAGTSVETDFVEAPSQMYEEWARRRETLALVSKFCRTPCPTVDETLAAKLAAAHNFGRGIRYARQWLYASFDMTIHGKQAEAPMPVWERLEAATPLGFTKGTQFPGEFTHLMDGYEAGYYGYMWSEVLALDMLSAFGDKLINPEVGRRYREKILSRGGEARGLDLVRDFLGREPNSKAFYDELAGKRLH